MSYTVTVGGSPVTIIPGETNNGTTSLTLIGKNVPNYGQVIAQNFIDLMQHFASVNSPRAPQIGQIWWNANPGHQCLQVYTGTNVGWKNIGAVTVATASPSLPQKGDLWYNDNTYQLSIYTAETNRGDNGWLLVGPAFGTTTGGINGPMVTTVKEAVINTDHTVLATYVDGQIVTITSKDPEFTLRTPINGKSNIKLGLNIMLGVMNGIAIQAQYADLAEKYETDVMVKAGEVVVFGGDKEITTTKISHDTRVAGIVSTDPAYLMNSDTDGVPVALTGKVPAYVQGPVAKGDRLVTSTEPGVAIKMNSYQYNPGCIIGKALQSIDDASVQVISVAVGRY
jgi:hypothetical protein